MKKVSDMDKLQLKNINPLFLNIFIWKVTVVAVGHFHVASVMNDFILLLASLIIDTDIKINGLNLHSAFLVP